MVLIRQPNADEIKAFRQKYRRNRRIAWGVIFAAIVAMITSVFVLADDANLVTIGIVGSMLVAGIASTVFWKCPRCKTLFGSRWRVGTCPGCGVQLDDRARNARDTD